MSPNHFEEHIAPSAPRARVGKRNLWDVKGSDRWLDQQSGLATVPARSMNGRDYWAMIVRVNGIKRVRSKGRFNY
jgi:hypothetical protein